MKYQSGKFQIIGCGQDIWMWVGGVQDQSHVGRDGRFGSKVGHIGPEWDKSEGFSDQISVHLARGRQMH